MYKWKIKITTKRGIEKVGIMSCDKAKSQDVWNLIIPNNTGINTFSSILSMDGKTQIVFPVSEIAFMEISAFNENED